MVGEVGVDAVAGEAAAQAVAAVALHGHGADGVLAVHARPGLVADAHEAAAAVDLVRRLFAVGGADARLGETGRPGARHALEQGLAAEGLAGHG